MAFIYETENFIIESKEQPFMPRTDGGHIRIYVKDESIHSRVDLEPKMAIELMRLTMIAGEALEIAMKNRGLPIVKINYQEMGNWIYKEGKKGFLHIHIFARASNAIKQPWPESMYLPDRSTGFYDGFEPLNPDDVAEVKKQIEMVEAKEKYKPEHWSLNVRGETSDK